LAETKEDYLKLIEKAITEKNLHFNDSRREYALTHSWENNLKNISRLQQNLIKKMLENKPKLKKNYIIYWFLLFLKT
jgi:hypothetical protein